MQGTITGRDVIRHTVTIVRLWGLACYLRCLRMLASHRRSTFLEILAADCAVFRSRGPEAAAQDHRRVSRSL